MKQNNLQRRAAPLKTRRFLPAALFAMLTTSLAVPALAAEPTDAIHIANAHRAQGLKLYEAGDFRGAIVEFRISYEASGDYSLLFAWAQAERLSGNCAGALPLYERFLKGSPSEGQVVATKTLIQQCREIAGKSGDPASSIVPTPGGTTLRPGADPKVKTVEPSTTKTTEPSKTVIVIPPDQQGDSIEKAHQRRVVKTHPWYRDTWGNILTGTGLLATGYGVYSLLQMNSAISRGENADNYGAFVTAQDEAEKHRMRGIVGASVGGALIVGGILRYSLRTETTVVSIDTESTSGLGGVIKIKGKF